VLCFARPTGALGAKLDNLPGLAAGLTEILLLLLFLQSLLA